MAYKDLAELRADVAANDNLFRASMEDVRKACGVGRLGALVRKRIAESDLPGEGLGYLPAGELPRYQDEYVWLYVRNSTVGQIISAVLEPSGEGETRLKAAAASRGSQAEKQVQEVREALAALVESLEDANEGPQARAA